MAFQTKYLHTDKMHNMESPRIIVSKLLEYYSPKSVVDFGCGLGTFLKAFKEKGVLEVLGLDGEWVNKASLNNYLESNEFLEVNLETKIVFKKKYDLAISLEVAEHLSKESAALFVQNLVAASDVILFSAAIPFQGGQNHINEQWVKFWQDEFYKYNYVFNDLLRSELWNNEGVKWWYRQNMFIVTSKEMELKRGNISNIIEIQDHIHPEHYLLKVKEHSDFRLGKSRTKEYLKLFIKSILYNFKILKR